MVGKHDPSVDVERRACADLPNRILERIDVCHQQIRPAVQQVRSEEESPSPEPDCDDNPARREYARLWERRKALRFSALRAANHFQVDRASMRRDFLAGINCYIGNV
jgi:hypothetical protein